MMAGAEPLGKLQGGCAGAAGEMDLNKKERMFCMLPILSSFSSYKHFSFFIHEDLCAQYMNLLERGFLFLSGFCFSSPGAAILDHQKVAS